MVQARPPDPTPGGGVTQAWPIKSHAAWFGDGHVKQARPMGISTGTLDTSTGTEMLSITLWC